MDLARTLGDRLPVATRPDHRDDLFALVGVALEQVDPERSVAIALTEERPNTPITVLALGKAAPAMTRGAAQALGSEFPSCIVVSDHIEEVPPGTELIVSSHPVPDRASLRAGEILLRAAAESRDPVLLLLSGGGSALAEVPASGVDLEAVAGTYSLMLRAGVPIQAANTVRTHLSRFKGGRLALAARSPVLTLVASDVGSDPRWVASGPTATCRTSPADAVAVLEQYDLVDRVHPSIRAHLAGTEAPPPLTREDLRLIADGSQAAGAMAQAGSLPIRLLTTALDGEASDAARLALSSTPPGEIGVLAGETTVTVGGRGRGGRNQEAALAAAIALEGEEAGFLSFATDGIDGPTDAAGAYVDGATAARIRAAGVDPVAALSDNNSHFALDAAGALIRCGPTGVNVADLWLVDRR